MQVFDRNLVRQRRERALAHLNSHDFLFKETATRLIERLDMIKRDFPLAVELGAREETFAKNLQANARLGRVIKVGSIAQQEIDLVADEEALPFAEKSIDALFSNMVLHWVNDLPGTLAQIRSALRPDGLFMAALAGGETLKELRECLMQAEMEISGGASPRVSPFVDLYTASGLLQRAGFALPVADSEVINIYYKDPQRLFSDLRGMGAANAVVQRLKKPTSRKIFDRALNLYQERYGDAQGGIIARVEIIFMIGWAPSAQQPQPLARGSAKVSLHDALT